MKKEYEKIYHDLEKIHFWHKARRKYIVELLKDVPKNLSVLDIGCSSGILLSELVDLGFDSNNLYGVDISEQAIENCKKINMNNTFVMDAQVIDLPKKFDILIASDCLEHLENDDKALKNWYSLLNPGGKLYVFVPALMSLWSEHDVANMHYRRYTDTELKSRLISNNFEIIKSSYWNFTLFLPIFIFRLLSKLKKNKTGVPKGDLEEIPLFNNQMYSLINFENKMLKFLNFPIGVSTFCIAKKP